ncbi:MAG: DUF1080 domain-containing protein [Gemmataceae bacterium]|nr:DUF1080 domain-containing protein [Gemmata sp.]MDW8196212.1 DUF1080 domain-containing protein [Gemmataceae bacterium]
MSRCCRGCAGAILVASLALIPAADPPVLAQEDGFRPLFNGKNLDGWVNVNCHPQTFVVKEGVIITTGTPTGFLRTEKQYENFILELDWMHVNKTEVGNSGLFVWGDPLPAVGSPYTRGIEVQILVNLEYKDKQGRVTATSHGDVFSIWGAKCKPDRPHPSGWLRCLPSEYRAKGGGEWNHYKVIANNGIIKLEVNGREVSGVSECIPRKGYLALESEGAECHFKNIRIKELPSTNPKPEEIADVWHGEVSRFNGLDLQGWTTEKDSWKVAGGKLVATGKAELVGEAIPPSGGVLIFDWRVPAKSAGELTVGLGGQDVRVKAQKPGSWQRETIMVRPQTGGTPIVFRPVEGLEIMNVFVRGLPAKP